MAEILPIEKRLIRYLRSGRVHPALCFGGPAHKTKQEALLRLAQYLFCPKRAEAHCGVCSNCQRIGKGIHPDVLVISETDDESIKIDGIRELCREMEIGALEGGKKLCLIEGAERLSAASANAFLKTLEEPGPDRFFWLSTAQPRALLPTVLSRCLVFTFPDVRDSRDLTPELEKKFGGWLNEAAKAKSPYPVIDQLDDKDDAVAFLSFIKSRIRRRVIGEKPSRAQELILLELFDEVLRVEGRLRSNANYGLLVETLLRPNLGWFGKWIA